MGLRFDAWPTDATHQMAKIALLLSEPNGIHEAEHRQLMGMVEILGIGLPADEVHAFVDHVLATAGLQVTRTTPTEGEASQEEIGRSDETTERDLRQRIAGQLGALSRRPLGDFVALAQARAKQSPSDGRLLDSDPASVARSRAQDIFRVGSRWLKNDKFVDEFRENGELVEYDAADPSIQWAGTWQTGSAYEPGLGEVPCVGIQVGEYFALFKSLGDETRVTGIETVGDWPSPIIMSRRGYAVMTLDRL